MGTYGIIMLIGGILTIIMGILGVGKNRRKNAWFVQLVGDLGYRITLIVTGIVIIVASFFAQ